MRRIIMQMITLSICIFGIALPAKALHTAAPWDAIAESDMADFVVAITPDRSVIAAGANTYGQCNVDEWTDVGKVRAGYHHTVGLRRDGTVVATGLNTNGQCDVESWTEIQDIAVDDNYTIGLKENGTVLYCGSLTDETRSFLDQWKQVESIFASHEIHGIARNGRVMSTLLKQEEIIQPGATQVLSIDDALYILTEEGKVFCFFLDTDTSFWLPMSNVIQIVDDSAFLALKQDGSVESSFACHDSWSDIVAVTANYGVKGDGTIVAAQDDELAQEVSNWKVLSK